MGFAAKAQAQCDEPAARQDRAVDGRAGRKQKRLPHTMGAYPTGALLTHGKLVFTNSQRRNEARTGQFRSVGGRWFSLWLVRRCRVASESGATAREKIWGKTPFMLVRKRGQ